MVTRNIRRLVQGSTGKAEGGKWLQDVEELFKHGDTVQLKVSRGKGEAVWYFGMLAKVLLFGISSRGCCCCCCCYMFDSVDQHACGPQSKLLVQCGNS